MGRNHHNANAYLEDLRKEREAVAGPKAPATNRNQLVHPVDSGTLDSLASTVVEEWRNSPPADANRWLADHLYKMLQQLYASGMPLPRSSEGGSSPATSASSTGSAPAEEAAPPSVSMPDANSASSEAEADGPGGQSAKRMRTVVGSKPSEPVAPGTGNSSHAEGGAGTDANAVEENWRRQKHEEELAAAEALYLEEAAADTAALELQYDQ